MVHGALEKCVKDLRQERKTAGVCGFDGAFEKEMDGEGRRDGA